LKPFRRRDGRETRSRVLEKNPPKQGLKRGINQSRGGGGPSFREKSTKTRIETQKRRFEMKTATGVLEKNPPKQGLKHVF